MSFAIDATTLEILEGGCTRGAKEGGPQLLDPWKQVRQQTHNLGLRLLILTASYDLGFYCETSNDVQFQKKKT